MSVDTMWESLDGLCVMAVIPGSFEQEQMQGLAAALAPQVRKLRDLVAEQTPAETVLVLALNRLSELLHELSQPRHLSAEQLAQSQACQMLGRLVPPVEKLFARWSARPAQFGCDRPCDVPCVCCGR